MDAEVQKRTGRKLSKNIIAISLIAFILLMLAIAGQITYTVLQSDKVYKGVYVDQHSVGGLSRQELTDFLEKNYQAKAKNQVVSIHAKDVTQKIEYQKIKVKYDTSAAVSKAFEVGRSGNIFDRLFEIIKTSSTAVKITVPYSYDKESAQKAVQAFYDKTVVPVREADIKVNPNNVVLVSGQHGEAIEKDKLLEQVEILIAACSSGDLEVPLIKTEPKKIDINDLFKKVSREAVDAKFEVKDKAVSVVPHIVGMNIDKNSLETIVQDLEKAENSQKVLPVEFITPKITTEMAQANLFKDTLGSMSTQFYTGNQNDANRGVNIRIAVDKINGTVLLPGQVFSFNSTVGPRSEAGGYKSAFTYVGGKIVPGIGGGICQVSTTLYNALLFSDMNVTERTNHMFTVGYVPYGRDAAVSYPDVDLKFKNSTNWPVKIEGWVTKGNQIGFSVKGTNETPGRTITINPQTVKVIDPPTTTKYVDDPTLPEGTEKLDHDAMKGCIIDTYKIVKQDGKVVKEEKLHRSVYKAFEKTVKRGTKKVAGAPAKPQGTTQPAAAGEAEIPPAKPTPQP
ncbi:MAG: VanW family protein [Clostridia bacterium]|nr:VanW family protein [Clostridia bacterium]